MVRRIAVLALVLLMPSFAVAQSKTDAAAKQIEAVERAIYASIQKRDPNAFQANVAEDLVIVDSNGPLLLADFMKTFNQITLTKFALDQVKVKFLSDTAAVLTYRLTGDASVNGVKSPSPSWVSTVFVNRAGKWVAVFHQESTIITKVK